MLKAKVGELDVKGRLEPTANALLINKYSAQGQNFLKPGNLDAVSVNGAGKLTIGVKSPAGVGISSDEISNTFNVYGSRQGRQGIRNNNQRQDSNQSTGDNE